MVVESIRKLTIWHTPTFHPIINHDELNHILSTLGFLPLPPAPTATTADAPVWKEYSFPAARIYLKGSSSPPRPRLPYPRIDGLHVNTYHSFLESVDVYLCMDNISDLFHIRGMPLCHAHDRHQKWVPMTEDDLVYVYREGMDLTTADNNADEDQNPLLDFVPFDHIISNG